MADEHNLSGRLSFDAYNEDGSPRLFAGTHRPPLAEVARMLNENPAAGPFGEAIYPWRREKSWREGVYDRPLYVVPD